MIAIWDSAIIGFIAYMHATHFDDGPRQAFLGWTYLTAFLVGWAVMAELGLDHAAVLQAARASASQFALVIALTCGVAVIAGLLARWSLTFSLSPVRVGLIFFGVSQLLFNSWYVFVKVKESS